MTKVTGPKRQAVWWKCRKPGPCNDSRNPVVRQPQGIFRLKEIISSLLIQMLYQGGLLFLERVGLRQNQLTRRNSIQLSRKGFIQSFYLLFGQPPAGGLAVLNGSLHTIRFRYGYDAGAGNAPVECYLGHGFANLVCYLL